MRKKKKREREREREIFKMIIKIKKNNLPVKYFYNKLFELIYI